MNGPEGMATPERFNNITEKNLEAIRRDYGVGTPGEGVPYHNELHTRQVMKAVKGMVSEWNRQFKDEPITAREEMLLEIAASGHDRVQNARERLSDFKPGDNEKLSAEEVEKEMREAKTYSEQDIAFVRACILGTIPEFAPNKLLQPMTETRAMVERGEISEFQFELTKLLADADLCAFGQGFDTFSEWALRLFKELKKKPEEFPEYLRYEISVLENHTWLSKVGATAFPHKTESIAKLKEMIERGATIA